MRDECIKVFNDEVLKILDCTFQHAFQEFILKVNLNSSELRYKYYTYIKVEKRGTKHVFQGYDIHCSSVVVDKTMELFVEIDGEVHKKKCESRHINEDNTFCTHPELREYPYNSFRSEVMNSIYGLENFIFCHAYKLEQGEYPPNKEYSHGMNGLEEFRKDMKSTKFRKKIQSGKYI